MKVTPVVGLSPQDGYLCCSVKNIIAFALVGWLVVYCLYAKMHFLQPLFSGLNPHLSFEVGEDPLYLNCCVPQIVYTNYLLIKLMMITVKVDKVSPQVLQALWALHRSLLPAVISPNSTHILQTWVSNLHSHLLGLLKDTFPPANKDSPISGKMESKWKTHWCMEESPLLAWMVNRN